MEPEKRARFLLNAACLLFFINCVHAQETIVAIRHAEKPATSLGQLTCKGLNRALALPKVLVPRYGKPDRIYAPDPGTRIGQQGNLSYSYVRPLMTIEPIAIQLEMPVNALIGFKNVGQLRKELLAQENENSVILSGLGTLVSERICEAVTQGLWKGSIACSRLAK